MEVYNGRRWRYSFPAPMADYRSGPGMAPYGFCQELTGIDGRWTGALKRHPGFQLIESVVAPAIGGDKFLKYAEVQKGSTGTVLRGYVVRVDQSGSVSFFYYDSSLGSWSSRSLGTTTSGQEYDISYGGRYLFFVKSGAQGRMHFHDGSSWYDLPLGYTSGMTFDFTLGASAVVRSSSNGLSEDPGDSLKYPMIIGVRFGDSRRGVWTPLDFKSLMFTAGATPGKILFGNNDAGTPPFDSAMQITVPAGITSDYDTIEVYRTVPGGGQLFREIYYHIPTEEGAGKLLNDFVGNAPGTPTALGTDGGTIHVWLAANSSAISLLCKTTNNNLCGSLDDDTLFYQDDYNLTEDAVGEVPKFTRIHYFGGANIGVGPISTDAEAEISDVSWSNLYQILPASFPGINRYRAPRLSDQIKRLVSAGDTIFGIAASRLFRFTRVGATMGIEKIAHGWGNPNRWAVCEMLGSVALLTDSTLVLINGATGEATTVGAVDRILQDPREWGGQTSDCFLVYDSPTSALYIVNPTLREALVLWGTTNAVTRLVDVPFIAGTSGPNPETGGVDRALLLSIEGRLMVPRLQGTARLTFMGVGENDPDMALSGTFPGTLANQTQVNFSTELGLSGTDIPGSGVLSDAYFYILHNDGSISKSRITSNGSTLMDLETAVSWVQGERFFFSPMVTEVVGWPLAVEDSPQSPRDRGRRKKVTAVGVDLAVLAGSNPEVRVECYKRDLSAPDVSAWITVDPDKPDLNVGATPISGPVLMPGVFCITPGSDFELLGMSAYGTLEATDKDHTKS